MRLPSTFILLNHCMNKNTIDELENTVIGKLAREIITDMTNPTMNKSENKQKILEQLNSYDGIGKIIGDIGLKMEAKLRSGQIDEKALLNEASSMSGKLKDLMTTTSNVVDDSNKAFDKILGMFSGFKGF